MTRFSIKNLSSLLQRIKSSAMQRMAAEQSAGGTGGTAEQSVLFDGLTGIFRTCGRKAAGGRQPRRKNHLVGSQNLQSEVARETEFHSSAPRRALNSSRSSSKPRSFADCLGFNTKSKPLGITVSDVRRISRTLLLSRFLSCALPIFRGVVSPNRLCSSPFLRANNTKERETRFAPPS